VVNIVSIIGVSGIFGALIVGIIWGGTPLLAYVDIPSVFIVVTCSIMIVIFAFPRWADNLGALKLISMVFKKPEFGELEIAKKLLTFSEKARREGLLSLEEEIQDLSNDFLQIGLRLSIDGTDRDIIMNLLDIEIEKLQDRHGKKQAVFDLWALVLPATGMWGTVMGLIGMMKNLNDPSSVGPQMSIALITTLYGSIMSNSIAIPVAKILRTYTAREINSREMIIEGVLSIQAGDNPRILGQKLLAYLPPEDRKALERDVSNN
jgi:chemotaxis protein MotA